MKNVVDKCANNMPHPNPSKVGLGAPPKFGPLAFNPKVFFQLCTRNCFCPGYLMSLQFKHPHPTPNYSLFGWAHSNCPNITLGDAFGIDILLYLHHSVAPLVLCKSYWCKESSLVRKEPKFGLLSSFHRSQSSFHHFVFIFTIGRG